MNVQNIEVVLFFVFFVTPIVFTVTRLIAIKTHNKKLELLSNKALQLVQYAEDLYSSGSGDGYFKKEKAGELLVKYASDVNIQLDRKQADQYVRAAYIGANLAGLVNKETTKAITNIRDDKEVESNGTEETTK